MRLSTGCLLLAFALTYNTMAQDNTRYMEPPHEILQIIDAPPTPSLSINPTATAVLMVYPQDMPDISTLAQPELRLAGIRINPNNFGESQPHFWKNGEIRAINQSEGVPITGLPEDASIRHIRWSPNGEKIALVVYTPTSIELWVADAKTAVATRWATNLNSTLMRVPFDWSPDSKSIFYVSRILSREQIDLNVATPIGPSIQVSKGQKATVRTYQDMLQTPMDEASFEHYTTSVIAKVSEGTNPETIGNPGMYNHFSLSPSGEFLLVEEIIHPFSYIVPYYHFASSIQVWNAKGHMVKKLAEIPASENIPQGFSAVREGPRAHQWRADMPATVIWAEALDKGNPKVAVDVRDRLFYLNAPFKQEPTPFLDLAYRFSGITWGWDNLAVVYERWWETRTIVTSFFNPSNPFEGKREVWNRSWQDAYSDPGSLLTQNNGKGYHVLRTNKSKSLLYLNGQGASPQGNMPFVDELNIKTLRTKRLWQCEAPYYEQLIAILDNNVQQLLTQRESVTDAPNFYIRNLKTKKINSFTSFEHPYPQLANVQKELVRYQRDDGIELSATLYLPEGYSKGDKKLPVLMWAYPQEYVNPKLAAQVTQSPYRFIRPGRTSPILWVTRGYAVMDQVGMPVVARDSLLPNDTFVQQITENAEAAINYIVNQGIGDSQRIAIGGHSYGAFMTANLLSHTNLFAAGIARSGAYNRTLTPFGFQGEERTYWEAQDVYHTMSPFMFAHKIATPLLLIHGADDNNSGTFPMQSERLYQAINGHGGTTRLVMLPYESHSYRARQSILHQAWEIDSWLKKYLGE